MKNSRNSTRIANCVGAFAALALTVGVPLWAGGTGSTQLFTPQGSAADTNNGDFLSTNAADDGIDQVYRYWAEVPPGLGTLTIELFDRDVGVGGAGELAANRDRNRADGSGDDWDTSAQYLVFNPAGTQLASVQGDDSTGTDNGWQVLYTTSGGTIPAGHWEIRVDMRDNETAGNDINAFGLRVHDGTSGSGGTEIPVYYDSHTQIGVNDTSGAPAISFLRPLPLDYLGLHGTDERP